MKANEIRIGNIVKSLVNNEEFSIVDEIGHKGALGYYVSLNNQSSYVWLQHNDRDLVLPIPLTEEWLLKFGFYNSEVFKNSFIKNGVDIYIQDTAFWYDLANDSIEIKTIHQLQNLYFALTNEELTMK